MARRIHPFIDHTIGIGDTDLIDGQWILAAWCHIECIGADFQRIKVQSATELQRSRLEYTSGPYDAVLPVDIPRAPAGGPPEYRKWFQRFDPGTRTQPAICIIHAFIVKTDVDVEASDPTFAFVQSRVECVLLQGEFELIDRFMETLDIENIYVRYFKIILYCDRRHNLSGGTSPQSCRRSEERRVGHAWQTV